MLQLNFLKQINPRMNFLFYFFPNSVWGFSSLYSTKTNWYLLGNNIPRGFRKIVNIFCFLFAYLLHLFLLCEHGPADEKLTLDGPKITCLIFFLAERSKFKRLQLRSMLRSGAVRRFRQQLFPATEAFPEAYFNDCFRKIKIK